MKRKIVLSTILLSGMTLPTAAFVTNHPFQSSHPLCQRQQKPRERVVVREPFMETGMTVIGIHHNPRVEKTSRAREPNQEIMNNNNNNTIQQQQLYSTKDLLKVTHPLAMWFNLCLVSVLGKAMSGPDALTLQPSALGTDSFVPDDSTSSTVTFLRDMSHVALDFLTVCSPSMLGMRIASVAGRLCSLAADYLPDHSMPVDEGIFQMIMLYMAVSGLVKSMTYHLVANHSVISGCSGQMEDSLYDTLFASAGFSWQQYKCFMTYAADWCVLSPGESVSLDDESEGNILLLVEGTVTETFLCGTEQTVIKRQLSSGDAGTNKHVLGEVDTLWKLPTRRRGPGVTNLLDRIFLTDAEEECSLEAANACCEHGEVTRIHWTANEEGARLLQLDIGALSTLVREYDNHLEEPLRNLAFNLARASLGKSQ